MEDMYIVKEGKKLRCGYTTGSCATAASKAAVLILEGYKNIKYVEIDTPAGVKLNIEIIDYSLNDKSVITSVIKDAGDDPDVTDGIKIYSKVSYRLDGKINIYGGEGIGIIKKKGLFGKIGESAINPIPKKMIEYEIRKISNKGFNVEIFAPEGKYIAEKTFNSNIGIEGGISIIGTKGIVYPMSEDAILKTIYLEIDMIKENEGLEHIVFVLGNYGERISEKLGIKKSRVKVSNYIGDSLLYAYDKGFRNILLIGHIGKFSKLSIGIFNTHSKVSDTRLEAFIYYLALEGVEKSFIDRINNTLTAEEAMNLCIDNGYGQIIKKMEKGAEDRIKRYLKTDDIKIDVIIYSMERGVDY